jgi:hypothetical protein
MYIKSLSKHSFYTFKIISVQSLANQLKISGATHDKDRDFPE